MYLPYEMIKNDFKIVDEEQSKAEVSLCERRGYGIKQSVVNISISALDVFTSGDTEVNEYYKTKRPNDKQCPLKKKVLGSIF